MDFLICNQRMVLCSIDGAVSQLLHHLGHKITTNGYLDKRSCAIGTDCAIMFPPMKTLIVVPAFNEEKQIGQVIENMAEAT